MGDLASDLCRLIYRNLVGRYLTRACIYMILLLLGEAARTLSLTIEASNESDVLPRILFPGFLKADRAWLVCTSMLVFQTDFPQAVV